MKTEIKDVTEATEFKVVIQGHDQHSNTSGTKLAPKVQRDVFSLSDVTNTTSSRNARLVRKSPVGRLGKIVTNHLRTMRSLPTIEAKLPDKNPQTSTDGEQPASESTGEDHVILAGGNGGEPPHIGDETEQREPDPYAKARGKLTRFLRASRPGSPLFEMARLIIRGQEAEGLLRSFRKEYRLYREATDFALYDYDKSWQFQRRERDMEQRKKSIDEAYRNATEGRGRDKRMRKVAGSLFLEHIFREYIKATTTQSIPSEEIQLQAARVAHEDLVNLSRLAGIGFQDMPNTAKEPKLSRWSGERRRWYDTQIYQTAAEALLNDPDLLTHLFFDPVNEADTLSVLHILSRTFPVFGVKHADGSEGLYSVEIIGTRVAQLPLPDTDQNDTFSQRASNYTDKISRGEERLSLPDDITIHLTSHLPHQTKDVYSIDKVERNGKEDLRIITWGDTKIGDSRLKMTESVKLKDLLEQLRDAFRFVSME